jgi:hypothetical protein
MLFSSSNHYYYALAKGQLDYSTSEKSMLSLINSTTGQVKWVYQFDAT